MATGRGGEGADAMRDQKRQATTSHERGADKGSESKKGSRANQQTHFTSHRIQVWAWHRRSARCTDRGLGGWRRPSGEEAVEACSSEQGALGRQVRAVHHGVDEGLPVPRVLREVVKRHRRLHHVGHDDPGRAHKCELPGPQQRAAQHGEQAAPGAEEAPAPLRTALVGRCQPREAQHLQHGQGRLREITCLPTDGEEAGFGGVPSIRGPPRANADLSDGKPGQGRDEHVLRMALAWLLRRRCCRIVHVNGAVHLRRGSVAGTSSPASSARGAAEAARGEADERQHKQAEQTRDGCRRRLRNGALPSVGAVLPKAHRVLHVLLRVEEVVEQLGDEYPLDLLLRTDFGCAHTNVHLELG
mmetsp:Transcript_74556/g.242044  ORF Transcript_74556/g.242044 Transcript_74556/m.242044 type:complete len:358 (-) Transcript_74556:286-1359(-)